MADNHQQPPQKGPIDSLIELVKAMRTHQKAYFKLCKKPGFATEAQHHLIKSKETEAMVDDLIEMYESLKHNDNGQKL